MTERATGKAVFWPGWLMGGSLAVLVALAVWWLVREGELGLSEVRDEARGVAQRVAARVATGLGEAGEVFGAAGLERLRFEDRPAPGGDGEVVALYEEAVRLAEADDEGFWPVASEVAVKAGRARTAAGLPVVVMVRWLQWEREPTEERREALLRAAVDEAPSVVTGRILELAEAGEPWRSAWAGREAVRALLEAGVADGWSGGWLVREGGRRFVREDEVERVVAGAVEGEGRGQFWVRVDVGGRAFGSGDRAGEALAGVDGVEVGVEDEAAVYGRVKRRVVALGAGIGLSVLVSVFGVWQARRAYGRQVELNEAKTNFVSSVSHELRAPVASIRLMADRLAAGKVEDAGRRDEYSRYIQGECRRLSSLIQNVLDVAKIESGRKAYVKEEADVRRLVADVVEVMRPLAEEAGVELALAGGDAPGETGADVDVVAVQQAVVNLVDNAVKHSPRGGAVEVGCVCQDGAVEVSVSDEGGGVSEGERERIFERFYRSGDELNRETPGAGIGLSLVRHTAEGHGGRAWVEPREGGGSRFVFRIATES